MIFNHSGKENQKYMRFTFNSSDWTTIEQGEKDCFLLANGLGGYCSLSVIGAAARGDEALLMAARKAPNVRWHLVTNVLEELTVNGRKYTLMSQRMKSGGDYGGFKYLRGFIYDDFDKSAPVWKYQIEDITLYKTLVMPHGENTVAVKYTVEASNKASNFDALKNVKLEVTPLIRLTPKKESFDASGKYVSEPYNIENAKDECHKDFSGTENVSHAAIENTTTVNPNTAGKKRHKCHKITHDAYSLYISTDAGIEALSADGQGRLFGEMYFSQDERDGRECYGNAYINPQIVKSFENAADNSLTVIFSDKPHECGADTYEKLADNESDYKTSLINKAPLKSDLGRQLALSADAYVVERASTNGKSIIAGYPFFEDWGRDTMIALAGATMVTGRFDECKSILRTFAKYVKNGLLPNLFPEGGIEPMYNSADAPLLFINAVYEYISFSNDTAFARELLPVMEQIVQSYQKGTDFHIKMDTDGLISAGDGLEQLTWMDVRVGDFLPTPRHGKPVEINAYWYNALMIMENLTGDSRYKDLAQKVKASFTEKFWNEDEQCLKDVLSGNDEENQIRCNQIWALSMPFIMLPMEKCELVLKKVKDELYTAIGLRTLSKRDKNFHEIYIGSMQERDRAYHQGTVWAYPLGAYYRAAIRFANKCGSEDKKVTIMSEVKEGLEKLKPWLKEGCVAQIAEIYDGGKPTISRGCYAQAWSVCELLRAVYDFEMACKI